MCISWPANVAELPAGHTNHNVMVEYLSSFCAQLHRRAECLDAGFQRFIAELLGGIAVPPVPSQPNLAAAEAAALVSQESQTSDTRHHAIQVAGKSKAWSQESLRDTNAGRSKPGQVVRRLRKYTSHESLPISELSPAPSSLSRIFKSFHSEHTADIVFVGSDSPVPDPHKTWPCVSKSFKASIHSFESNTSAPSSAFLARFSDGPAEVEFHPAPIKTVARMHEKLGEYAAAGVPWPRCAAILDPVCCPGLRLAERDLQPHHVCTFPDVAAMALTRNVLIVKKG